MREAQAILRVDLNAIARNYRTLRDRFTGQECAAVVKANAYGLGAIPVAQKLFAEGCRKFFVATLDEALALKPYVEDAGLFVFHGPALGEEKEFFTHGISPVLNSREQWERWNGFCQSFRREDDYKTTMAALHIDTGMCRLGLDMREALALDEKELAQAGVGFLMSHLACAGEPKHPMNAAQLSRAETLQKRFPRLPFSLANSSGIFLSPDFHFDLARPGCALYGITPNEAEANPMENVVVLSAPILQLRTLSEQTPVGYGATVSAPAGTRVATVAFGYADGMLRSSSNLAEAHVKGVPCPVLGRVSMDMIMLDVSKAPELSPGDRAVLIGPDQPVDAAATRAGTIGYEIFTRLGNRVAREYIGQ